MADAEVTIRQLYDSGRKKTQITNEYGLVVRKVEGTDEPSQVIKQEEFLSPNNEISLSGSLTGTETLILNDIVTGTKNSKKIIAKNFIAMQAKCATKITQADNTYEILLSKTGDATTAPVAIKQEDLLFPNDSYADQIDDSYKFTLLDSSGANKRAKLVTGNQLLAQKMNNISSNLYDTLSENPDSKELISKDNINKKVYNILPDVLHPNNARGIYLDSSAKVISIADNANIKTNADFTAIAFGKINVIPTGDSAVIMMKTDASTGKELLLSISAIGNIVLNTSSDGSAFTSNTLLTGFTSAYYTKNNVYFLERTGNTWQLYINNVLRGQTTITSIYQSTNGFKPFGHYSNYGSSSRTVLRAIWFNYALNAEERAIVSNSFRADKTMLPDYMKWGSNTEIMTDSGFDDPTKWTVTGYWSIASSKISRTNTLATNYFTQSKTIKKGDKYRVTIDVDSVSPDNAYLYITNELGTALFSDGYKTYIKGSITVFETTALSNATAIRVYSSDSYAFSLNSVSVVKLGAVADYKAEGIVQSLGTTATTTITVGVAYEIVSLGTSNFVSIGASQNVVGQRFIATGSNNGNGTVKLVSVTQWLDSSTNVLNATVSGSPKLVNVQVEEYEGKGIIDTNFPTREINAVGVNTSYLQMLPPMYVVSSCILHNYGTVNVTIKIGSTNGGAEYVSSKQINAGEEVFFNVPDNKNPFSSTGFNDFWINSNNWNSGKIFAKFNLRRVTGSYV